MFGYIYGTLYLLFPNLLRSGTDKLALHPVRNPRFGSFRTQPLEILSADSVRISLKRTQPLEQILDSEFLLCELGVGHEIVTPLDRLRVLAEAVFAILPERELVGRPILYNTTTTRRGWCIEAFVSTLAHLQYQKLLPGGGGV